MTKQLAAPPSVNLRPGSDGGPRAPSHVAVAGVLLVGVCALLWSLLRRTRRGRRGSPGEEVRRNSTARAAIASEGGGPQQPKRQQQQQPTKAGGRSKGQQQQQQQQQQPHREKAQARLEWWQRLNALKPTLVLPEPQQRSSDGAAQAQEEPAAYRDVVAAVQDRLGRGRDWLVRDSDYGSAPAHVKIKVEVNKAITQALQEVAADLPEALKVDPRRLLLLLEAPQYATLRVLVEAFPELQYSQQVVIPQADLGHYFEMLRGTEFYPGVRAQRLDHWLCANAGFGHRCYCAFLDFECRLVGAMSARLCPAADVMRYFRFGYPAEPASVLAITVGLEEPAVTPEAVDAFVRWEAELNGYSAELRQSWKYRMVTLLYIVRRL